MHMICPSVPISASTELTEFLYISCRKKLPHSSFRAPSLLAPGCICPLPRLLSATADKLPNHTIKFGLLCKKYEMQFLVYVAVVVPVSILTPMLYANLLAQTISEINRKYWN